MNRRDVLGLGVPLMMASAAGLDVSGPGIALAAADEAKLSPTEPPKKILFPNDIEFWFSTYVLMGSSDYGGSQMGEILATTSKIVSEDYNSWYNAWNGLADKLYGEASGQLAKNHRISARDNFLRASNYYRVSEFFLHGTPDDPRMARAYKRTVECYKSAGALFEPKILPVEIPYENTTLPGYMCFPKGDQQSRTTVIMFTGYDGAAEDMHYLGFAAAIERGYNALVFDGPGQFGPIHRERLPFRPDWEKVVTPVVDFTLKLPGVDPSKLALMGASMGGYLAPRAAAFEKRIKAVICNDGVYDFSRSFVGIGPADQREAFIAGLKAEHAPHIDELIAEKMKGSPRIRWFMEHGTYAFGAKTPREFIRKVLDYNLRNGIAEKISCPTLVCRAEADGFGVTSQARDLYDHLTCPKTFVSFTAEEGAGEHCEIGANRLAYARIYDWLDELFAQT